jgi:hypothetical protein
VRKAKTELDFYQKKLSNNTPAPQD